MGRAIQSVRRCSLYGTTIMLTLHSSAMDLFDRLDQQMASAERVPNAEILDSESSYTVRLELPGVDRNSIDSKAPLLSEFRSGTWSRSFRFPHSLDRDQLKATYRDGILEITAGKAVEHTSVSVTVED